MHGEATAGAQERTARMADRHLPGAPKIAQGLTATLGIERWRSADRQIKA